MTGVGSGDATKAVRALLKQQKAAIRAAAAAEIAKIQQDDLSDNLAANAAAQAAARAEMAKAKAAE